jgi:hypothetical protein
MSPGSAARISKLVTASASHGDGVELGERVRRQDQASRGDVLAQMVR